MLTSPLGRPDAPTLLSKRLLVSIMHPERDLPLTEIRPQPVEKTSPARAGQSFLNDPLTFELLKPAADRLARHAEPGGQEPLRPPKFIAAGPQEPDQDVFGRLPCEQSRKTRRVLAAAYGQASSRTRTVPAPARWSARVFGRGARCGPIHGAPARAACPGEGPWRFSWLGWLCGVVPLS